MTIARSVPLALVLALVSCAGSTSPADSPQTAARVDVAKASEKADPCAELPACPVACSEPIDSIAGRSCGSEGLQCGDEAAVCSCKGSQWLCDRPEKPRESLCPRSCREET